MWKHGLCGCFDNFGVCIITYFLPCYTFGKNAEAVGESCCLCGLLYFVPLANLFAIVSVRGRIRESSGIPGDCCSDLLTHMFCHFCALVQEAQEVETPSERVVIIRS
ncbi:hypothetical protein BaRGS_00006507 [Batillaria attramentaria]|uniref:Uncharacterized protein n=1 Tax=Batillaria attramentaria TaxID=370345 RepID=A0ABD0LST2_9CAEN